MNILYLNNAIESNTYPYICMETLGQFWYLPKLLIVFLVSYIFTRLELTNFLRNAILFVNVCLGYAVFMNLLIIGV
jgi:hypothetical protein